jgi:hypothetical protein
MSWCSYFTKPWNKLSSSPVLGFPDFKMTFRLETDACLEGLGAVLSQEQEQGTIVIWKIWMKCEMIWKIWKKSKLKSEKIWKIQNFHW